MNVIAPVFVKETVSKALFVPEQQLPYSLPFFQVTSPLDTRSHTGVGRCNLHLSLLLLVSICMMVMPRNPHCDRCCTNTLFESLCPQELTVQTAKTDKEWGKRKHHYPQFARGELLPEHLPVLMTLVQVCLYLQGILAHHCTTAISWV